MNSTLFVQSFCAIASLVGLAMIFKKMGVAWWKALIPVYGEYVLFEKVWNIKMFLVALFTSISASMAWSICSQAATLHQTEVVLALTMTASILGVLDLVFGIKLLNKIAKAFGHGTGYTVGLVFLPVVFLNILGFGKSQYKFA